MGSELRTAFVNLLRQFDADNHPPRIVDRLLHHGHILKRGPRSWRTKTGLPSPLPKGVEEHRPGSSPLAGFAVTIVGRF